MTVSPARFPRLLARAAAAALLLGCAAVARPAPAAAQQDTVPLVASETLLEVRLADGSTLYGRIVSVQGGRVLIETSAGARIEVDRAQVRSARPVRGAVGEGGVWHADPHRDRLFLGPTGRTLAAGEGSFAVYEVFVPALAYGVTDWLTVTAGVPVIPGELGSVAYLEPRVRLPLGLPGASISAGAAVFFGTRDEGAAGLLYGAGTFGGDDRALHVMAGVPFISDGEDENFADQPLVMVGGETRVSRRVKLLTENYFVPGENGVLVMGGARFFGERLSADAGLAVFLGEDCDSCYLPVVNFAYAFGGPRR